MTDSQKDLLYRYGIIILLVLAAFGNTLNHGFVWDDINIIVDHPLMGDIRNLPKLLLTEDIADVPTGYYRPITYVSFALERTLWGLNPVGFNITNLVLHILVALLFYRVIAALFKRENLALVAALLFALHPIVGETVNFHAGGRNTLLCACFSMLTLLLHIKKKQIPALLCFMLAILSKEFALLVPVLLVMSDWITAKENIRWKTYLLYLAAIICYLALRSYVVTVHTNLLSTVNLSGTFWILPRIIGSYFINMAYPLGLKTMYDVNTIVTWSSFIAFSILILMLISAAFIFRKRWEILLSVTMFFLFLLPVSNIFPLGITMMADRYAYFATFGFSLALAYVICKANNKTVLAIMVVLCALFIGIDVKRNGFWKDEVTLFTQMTKDAPDMSVGFQGLGYAYYEKQDFVDAENYLSLALTKRDVNAKMLVGSATMFWDMKKLDKALMALGKKIAMEPQNPQPYIMASRIYEEMGDPSRAKQYHDKAQQLYPGIFEMMTQRVITACRYGEELMARQRVNEAERYFKEALSIDPAFVPALLDMGGLIAEKGNPAKALEYFSKAARLNPLNPAAYYNMAIAYEMLGKATDAQEAMKKFKELEARSSQENVNP